MTKKMTLSVCICIMLCMFVGSAAAALPIEVSIFTNMVGEGIMDRTIILQTEKGFEGLKFNVDVYTPSLGRYGISFLNYTEELSMVLDNETMIDVVGSGIILNTKTVMGIKNYEMDVSASHKVVGDYILDYEYMADRNITARYLVGKVDGQGDVCALMVDPSNRTYIVKDRAQFNGNFEIESETEISRIDYPASDIGEDWLRCP